MTARPSRPPTPVRRALASAPFRRLFLAATASRWGDTFNTVALVVTVFELTGSGTKVAATVGFEILPVLLFGFVAGASVDRLPRRRVLIAADVARAVIALVLAAGHGQLWVVYAGAFALSAVSQYAGPAFSSLLPSVVPTRDLTGANTALWSAAVASQVVLAPVAGVLVATAGPGWAFGVNAISFLASAVVILGLHPDRPAGRVDGRRLEQVAEGLRSVRSSPFLSTLAAVQGLAALSAGATSALLVVLAGEHLGAGPGRFGVLLSAIGVGAAVGPVLLQHLLSDFRRPGPLFGPYLVRGGVDLVLATSSSFGVATAALAVYGVGTSTGMVTYQSVLQATVPERLRGRTFAFYDVVWQSARLVSLAAGGVLADALGVRAVYVVGGVLLLGAGALGLARARPVDVDVDVGDLEIGDPAGPQGLDDRSDDGNA